MLKKITIKWNKINKKQSSKNLLKPQKVLSNWVEFQQCKNKWKKQNKHNQTKHSKIKHNKIRHNKIRHNKNYQKNKLKRS